MRKQVVAAETISVEERLVAYFQTWHSDDAARRLRDLVEVIRQQQQRGRNVAAILRVLLDGTESWRRERFVTQHYQAMRRLRKTFDKLDRHIADVRDDVVALFPDRDDEQERERYLAALRAFRDGVHAEIVFDGPVRRQRPGRPSSYLTDTIRELTRLGVPRADRTTLLEILGFYKPDGG